MEKKFKFSDNPTVAKGVYGAVIALLCITAIIVGIIAANNRKKDTPDDNQNPPVADGNENGDNGNTDGDEENPGSSSDAVTFISPVSGKVMKHHSIDVPVYSTTLEEWRIHTGIDVSVAEGADVFAAAEGNVSRVYSDPLLGNTVEITHSDGSKSLYSNLSADGLVSLGKDVASGEKIGVVGDSAISEIADEAHLHFEILVNGASVDPLNYLTEESKQVSLGISDENEAT